ncbi:trypsin-like serine protease [Amycolatopsis sp. NPDC004079]|uniref:trypsin-like serine protease n=1 Tax=Amycolatopsis sp. NPDC004079 TaxID=3154549 RepID=UPI0033BD8B61
MTSAAVTATAVGLVAGPATPAQAIVGGHRASENLSGIGAMVYDHNQVPDWDTCAAHPLGSDENGQTRFLVTAAHCVTVMPGPQSQQVRSMTDDGRTRYEKFRRAAEKAGKTTGDPGFSPGAAAGLHSTPEDPATWNFMYGNVNRFAAEKAKIKRFIVPAGWAWGEKDEHGDVWDQGLVEMEEPIQVEGALVAPVLPWAPVTLQGWGKETPNPESWKGPLGPWLKETDVRVTARSECAAAGIGRDEVCLGTPPDRGGPCMGDSGGGGDQRVGPYVVLTVLVSRGTAEHCGTANVATSVWAHGRWILSQIHAADSQTRVAVADPAQIREAAARHHATVPAQTDFAAAG